MKFVSEFEASTVRTVTTIVDERSRDDTQRTIRPIDVGGVAGGQKFLHDGVFIKYALDHSGMYVPTRVQ